MKNKAVEEVFEKTSPDQYDSFNDGLSPISDNLHFLSQIILKDLPPDAHILCVGVGTGSEIIKLNKYFPHWKFTGVEPSEAMLQSCRKKIEESNLMSLCDLQKGYITEKSFDSKFDAAICFLVMHFIQDLEERMKTFESIYRNLLPGGIFINSEISTDMNSNLYEDILTQWKKMLISAGATQQSANNIPQSFETFMRVQSPCETKKMMSNSGFQPVILFFQSLLIKAWYAKKEDL